MTDRLKLWQSKTKKTLLVLVLWVYESSKKKLSWLCQDVVMNVIIWLNVPRYHDNKIHDVPHVPEVGVLVENESHRHYLGAHLDCEDSLQNYNLNALTSLWLPWSTMKTGSNSSSWRERMVLSLLAILLSIDITTQLDIMVMIINHSNGGQVTNQTNKRLKQLKNQ